MKWRAFRYGQDTYDLSHLHPKTIRYVQKGKDDKPERTYIVDVVFSLHCFTRGIKAGEIPDIALCYADARETRIFDFARYALSHHLPDIVDGLSGRKCYHSGKGNFFTIEVIDGNGKLVEYEVFFNAYRSDRKGVLNLIVQSAYVRDQEHSNRPHMKLIDFNIILFNVLIGKKIKVPK